MRAFLLFVGLMIAALAAIALFTYPAWLLLHPHFNFPFHRLGERIGMLALLIGFVLVAKRAGLADKQSLGYALPRRRFVHEMLFALAIGAVGMLAVVGIMTALGLRTWSDTASLSVTALVQLLATRLLSGIAVAFIEETFLRGAMFTAIERESGVRTAVVLTAVIYSATHFFASFHIAADRVTASSGFDLLAGTLHVFTNPLEIIDAFLCLFAVGVVLAVIRAVTGNIAACLGLHAGWVWVMLVAHQLSTPIRDEPLSFLLSGFDGFVGWLVLVWTILTGVGLYELYSRRMRSDRLHLVGNPNQ
jgi:membrane protease YdiL (CAAX protease family)